MPFHLYPEVSAQDVVRQFASVPGERIAIDRFYSVKRLFLDGEDDEPARLMQAAESRSSEMQYNTDFPSR